MNRSTPSYSLITAILKEMNEYGFSTASYSLETSFNKHVHISFYTSPEKAKLLEKNIRDISSRLKWSWKVSIDFDEEYDYIYTLSTQKIKSIYMFIKYMPNIFDADLKYILNMINNINKENQDMVFETSNLKEKIYRCERDGIEANTLINESDVLDFLDACGINKDSLNFDAALSGWPIEIDGSTIRFILVEK